MQAGAPRKLSVPLLAEASELTAMLTAGMNACAPVALRVLSGVLFVLVLSS